jgi:uncharacterized protein YabN with tetrapyrrole methylase and pyrophosphatase domain
VTTGTAGSLTVVGTGIRLNAHLTSEARLAIRGADVVLCLLAEPTEVALLETLNARTRSLHPLYEVGRERRQIYAAISDEIVGHVRQGLDVCVALYGHPGLFATPAHDALGRARDEGFPTRLLPGVSAEDCLFADLGIDPGRSGWQSYDAGAFLARRPRIEPSAALVLWQVGVVGEDVVAVRASAAALPQLVDVLLATYAAEHTIVVYQASAYAGFDPIIRRVPLGALSQDDVTAPSTLYIPPFSPPEPD